MEHPLKLVNDISKIIHNELETSGISEKDIEVSIMNISGKFIQDLAWLSSNDQASIGVYYTGNTYKSALAIMYYRVCSYIYKYHRLDDKFRLTLSRKLSEESKVLTGIEIHPGAEIGECFAIDHGYSTVIGETVRIGRNCIILNGVTLGAIDVADDKGIGKTRHPVVGDNVILCAFSRVYGSIKIGDNCFIGPYATITHDIPNNSRVVILEQHQITTINDKKNDEIECIYSSCDNNNEFAVKCDNLKFKCIEIISFYSTTNTGINIVGETDVIHHSHNCIKFEIKKLYSEMIEQLNIKNFGVRIYKDDSSVTVIPYSLPITKYCLKALNIG